jgi:hypothetical protein
MSVEMIRELAQAELVAFTAWLDEPEDEETGDDLPPDSRYWDPLEMWLRGYSPQELPIAQREMKALDAAYQRFNETGNAIPEQDFWLARDAAHKACMKDPPALKPRKTPAELVAEKVPLRQIAYEWRLLTDRNGQKLPDIERVQQELDQPGSVLTPEYIAADDKWRLAQMGFISLEPVSDEPWRADSIAEDETLAPAIFELIEERASVSQIAGLLNDWKPNSIEVWEAAVRAVATAMRIHLPANSRETVNEGGRDMVAKESGQAYADRPLDSHPVMDQSGVERATTEDEHPPQPSDTEAEVLQRFEAGEDVGSIASAMSMSPKKVKAAINKWQARV